MDLKAVLATFEYAHDVPESKYKEYMLKVENKIRKYIQDEETNANSEVSRHNIMRTMEVYQTQYENYALRYTAIPSEDLNARIDCQACIINALSALSYYINNLLIRYADTTSSNIKSYLLMLAKQKEIYHECLAAAKTIQRSLSEEKVEDSLRKRAYLAKNGML